MSDFFSGNNKNIRLWIVLFFVAILFSTLIYKLYVLQIKQGEHYINEVKLTTLRDIPLKPQRGNIYDRYGRELAVNEAAYTVNLDPSATAENINSVLLNLVELFDKNNEKLLTELPITTGLPRAFLFDGNEDAQKRWKEDMGLDASLDAEQCYNELIKLFEINTLLPNETVYKLVSLRSSLYEKRFSKYIKIPIAYNISQNTASVLLEKSTEFSGVTVETEQLRKYPYGKYLSHILGYTGNINQDELDSYGEGVYDASDLIGKDGIEQAFEQDLRGKKGIEHVEIDVMGKRVNTFSNPEEAPVNGNDIQLTIDAELQKTAYDAIESALRKEQISRLTTAKNFNYTTQDIFENMIKSDNIRIRNIMNSKEGTVQGELKAYIMSIEPEAMNDLEKARTALKYGYIEGPISSSQLILALYEQGRIFDDDNVITRVKNGDIDGNTALILKLERDGGDITPQMTGMDPCSASVVVEDIHTGDVLAAAAYPSYDNNELVNDFNNEYYISLQNDPTTPMVNRPFTEPKAPGSIFKMITAVAGLKEGVITTNSTIHDNGIFKDAGQPYARCWISPEQGVQGTHGDVDVAKALEVSCNYFFYSVSYMMGEHSGNSTHGIDTLNKYMRAFGLDSKTGVEIYELYNSMNDYPNHISSPDYKDYVMHLYYPDAQSWEYNWTAGDTIRTAIGQSYNNYTCATVTKYISTLANGGTRYSMHLMNRVISPDKSTVKQYTPIVEETIDIPREYLDTIYDGMYRVTTGENGTLKKVFNGYPIKIGAKSGTAEESSERSEHTTFAAFAPFDDPRIAITVYVPFGSGDSYPAPNIAKSVISKCINMTSSKQENNYNTLLK